MKVWKVEAVLAGAGPICEKIEDALAEAKMLLELD